MSELSPQQAEALGLPPGGPAVELAPHEAQALGLPPGGPGSDAAPSADSPHSKIVRAVNSVLPRIPGSSEEDNLEATDNALGFATGTTMPDIPGVKAAAGWVGRKIGPAAEALVQKFTNAVGDKSASAAEQTARSATGTLGKLTSEGSATLKTLADETALSAEDIAKNQAALQTPEAMELKAKLAGKARERLPEQLGRIESARGMAEQATADAAAARSPEAIDATAAQMRKDAVRTLATRYLAPAAGGAVAGWALGGDDHGGAGALGGAAMGLLHRPALGFVSRQIVKSPAFGLPLARAALSTSEKLASMARTGAPELGRFGPILSAALSEGPQSFAAHTYALGQQDADFQALQQKLAESK